MFPFSSFYFIYFIYLLWHAKNTHSTTVVTYFYNNSNKTSGITFRIGGKGIKECESLKLQKEIEEE